MKNIRNFAVLICLLSFFGCALFSNEAQYDKGDWYFVTGSGEVARIKQDKLAFEKIKASPVKVAYIDNTGNVTEVIPENESKKNYIFKGYKGKIFNFSYSKKINFIIKGPETKGFFTPPGQQYYDYLIPGTYEVRTYQGGYEIEKPKIFHVTARTNNFMGEELHWYVGYDSN